MSTYVHEAHSYLNYPGDVRDGLHIGQAMGPDWWGQLKYVVDIDYASADDMTVVGMSPVRPL